MKTFKLKNGCIVSIESFSILFCDWHKIDTNEQLSTNWFYDQFNQDEERLFKLCGWLTSELYKVKGKKTEREKMLQTLKQYETEYDDISKIGLFDEISCFENFICKLLDNPNLRWF